MPDRVTVRDEPKYNLPAEGEYRAMCVDVIDMGKIPNKISGKLQPKTALVFQLEDVDPATGKYFEITERFTVSLYAEARLREFLGQWRGRPFNSEEAKKGVELAELVGVPALVNVVHNEVGDKKYANIFTIARLPKGAQPVKVNGYQRSDYWAKKKTDAPASEEDGGSDDETPF